MDELLALTNDGLFVFVVLGSDDPLLGLPGSDVETVARTKSPVQEPGRGKEANVALVQEELAVVY